MVKKSFSYFFMTKIRKGQAAMEFLMTYGWAILVVIAAIGTLSYFGVLDMGNFLPERCHFPTGFDCIGRPAVHASDNSFRFILQNDYGNTITLRNGSLTVDSDCTGTATWCLGTGCSGFVSTALPVANNNRVTVKFDCAEDITSGRFKADVVIDYNDSLTNFNFTAKGQIRAKA